MAELLSNRMFALFCCIVMIVASSVAGSNAWLKSLRAQAEASFLLGDLQSDLEDISGQAYNLTVIADRYLPGDDADAAGLLAERAALNDAKAPGEKYRAYKALTEQADRLRQKLDSLPLSDQDRDYVRKCTANIDSARSIVTGSSGKQYNMAATDFNNTIAVFPADVLGGLTGIKPLELFE